MDSATQLPPDVCLAQGSQIMYHRGYIIFHRSIQSRKNFWSYFDRSCRRGMSVRISWPYRKEMPGFSSKSSTGYVPLEQSLHLFIDFLSGCQGVPCRAIRTRTSSARFCCSQEIVWEDRTPSRILLVIQQILCFWEALCIRQLC